jgi:hypothetical protein
MDDKFFKSIEHLKDDTMGTEHVAHLLYSLIRMCKPTNILEIGIGYTTPFILQAVRENYDDTIQIHNSIKSGLVDYNLMKNLRLAYYNSDYKCTYTGVDNMSHKNCELVVDYIKKQIDIEYILHLDDYNTLPRNTKYDFIWMDCGDYNDYSNLLKNFTTVFSDGALILLHNISNTPLHNSSNFLEIVEPNNINQNSIGIIKYVKSN